MACILVDARVCLLNCLRSKNTLKQGKFLNFWKWQLNLRSGKTWKGHGKSHGKSWNLKGSKEYEPCFRMKSACIYRHLSLKGYLILLVNLVIIYFCRRPEFDAAALENRNHLPSLDSLRWRVDVAISTR